MTEVLIISSSGTGVGVNSLDEACALFPNAETASCYEFYVWKEIGVESSWEPSEALKQLVMLKLRLDAIDNAR